MRRLLLGAGVTLAVLAAPAWGSTRGVDVKDFEFTPANVTIIRGDRVTWTFRDGDHSVTSDPSSSEHFDSDPLIPEHGFPSHAVGATFSHDFNTSSTFAYHCKLHDFMHGKVVVKPPGSDVTAPVVSGVKITPGRTCRKKKHCKRRGTKIAFRLSEPATVRITFKRKKGKSPKAVKRQAKAGKRTVKLSLKRVPRGSYTVKLVATDAAGNKSSVAKRTFKVKGPAASRRSRRRDARSPRRRTRRSARPRTRRRGSPRA